MYSTSDYVYNISKNFNYGTAAHPFGMNASAHTDLSPPSQAYSYPSGGPVIQEKSFAAMGHPQRGHQAWFNGPFFPTGMQDVYNTDYDILVSFNSSSRYQASIPTLLRHLSEIYEQDARTSTLRAQRNEVYTQTSLPPGSSMDLSRPVRCSDVTVPPLSEPAWPIDETLDALNKNLADILAMDLSRPVRCSDVTVPPLSEPAWPIDETLDALNKNLADILARPPPLSTPHTSTSTLAPAQHLLPQQDDVGYQYGTVVTDEWFGTSLAVTAVHSEAANQPYAFDHQNTTGQLTSSKPWLVELEQAQVYNHGQSQNYLQPNFRAYKSESDLDQALVEVPSPVPTAVPQPAVTASSQTSQESFQPNWCGSSLDMALVEGPSPASTVVSTPAMAPTSTSATHAPSIQSAPASTMHAQPAMIPTSTSTNNTPSSQSVPVPTCKRKAGTVKDPNTSASAPSSSAPRKKRKSTSSPKPRQPPRPRYFPSTSSYRPIESRLPAMVPEQVEGYQRLPRDPNASVCDMLGIPTSVGRPGSRHGPFKPRSKEDSRRS
ncbi:hypothetical protein CVT26_006540 [Gymnopilus dilepis]|uniref:Uncharacterized protein n=1 Tax=Gymnopilus dilepis TaxID=231916 RepID=A0A409Y3C6_9AGAR|nr:hypothetical protein CVT26_006540 [Gymnopilus dilepis]